MQERKRTISRHFFDDEILFKDPTTGDLHLKEGVTRLKYNTLIDPYLLESHINEDELNERNSFKLRSRLGIEIETDRIDYE